RGDLRALPVVTIVVLARAFIAWLLFVPERLGLGDIPYYWRRAGEMPTAGLDQTFLEYPTPVAWMLSLPQWLGGHSLPAYAGLFIVFILLTDLAFCALIWATGAPWRGWAIAFWSVLCATLGPLIWLRFDLIPAVAVGAATLLAARRPGAAAASLALGTATKLWPGVLFPLLLNRPGPGPRRWLPPVIGFGVVGVVAVAASLAAAGWDRLVSPLLWQSDRGLQIEAIAAMVPMLLRAIGVPGWQVEMSTYQAFEVFGPQVGLWLRVADGLAIGGVVIGIAALIRHWRRPYADPDDWAAGAAVAMLGLICLLIVTNKTLSPQYVIWLGGPMVGLIAWRGGGPAAPARGQGGDLAAPVRGQDARVPGSTPRAHGWLVRWSIGILLIGVTTYVVFPVLYEHLWLYLDPTWTPWATALLMVRNGALLVLTVDVLRHCLRSPSPRTD
ncbi:MAG: hypothetical protein Q4F67_11015, partial [Propionibacteriaceae bacterium]|nr:hypothetical protein [Propionibacteriaceae bacterium]